MRLEPSTRRAGPESVLPMINVVFLLLIFLLMSATLAPQAPVEAAPPRADIAGAAAAEGATLYLTRGGETAFGPLRGAQAVAAALRGADGGALVLLADARAPARDAAALTARLIAGGAGRVLLRVEPVR